VPSKDTVILYHVPVVIVAVRALSPGVEKLYTYTLLLLPTPTPISEPPITFLLNVIILLLSAPADIVVALNQQEIVIGEFAEGI